MVEILFELNGTMVDPNLMNHGLQKSILTVVKEALGEQVGEVECAEHGTSPKILCRGPNVVEMSMEISACCDHVLDTVETRLH